VHWKSKPVDSLQSLKTGHPDLTVFFFRFFMISHRKRERERDHSPFAGKRDARLFYLTVSFSNDKRTSVFPKLDLMDPVSHPRLSPSGNRRQNEAGIIAKTFFW